METKTNEGSSTTSDSASTINTVSLYDYLKQFYEKENNKPGTELWTKAPGEPFKVCVSEWKIKRYGNSKQNKILYHPNHVEGVQ